MYRKGRHLEVKRVGALAEVQNDDEELIKQGFYERSINMQDLSLRGGT
jgi:hypothetical protein